MYGFVLISVSSSLQFHNASSAHISFEWPASFFLQLQDMEEQNQRSMTIKESYIFHGTVL